MVNNTEHFEDGSSVLAFSSSNDKRSKQYFQTCGNGDDSESDERTDRFSKVMLLMADTGDEETEDAAPADQKGSEDATPGNDRF